MRDPWGSASWICGIATAGVRGHEITKSPSFREHDKVLSYEILSHYKVRRAVIGSLTCVPGAMLITLRYFPYLNSCIGYLDAMDGMLMFVLLSGSPPEPMLRGKGDRRSPETMSLSPCLSMTMSSFCRPGTSSVAETLVDCGSSHNCILRGTVSIGHSECKCQSHTVAAIAEVFEVPLDSCFSASLAAPPSILVHIFWQGIDQVLNKSRWVDEMGCSSV